MVHLVGRSADKLSELRDQLTASLSLPLSVSPSEGSSGDHHDRIQTAVIDAVNDPKAVDEFFSKRLDRVTGVANCIGSVIL